MDNTINDWRDLAACRDSDPELFFPVSEVGPGARQVADAKAVCARCPVRSQCLDYAIDNRLTDGIFGGTTEAERRQLARRRHADRHVA
ncbi:WhiB family transcriptional regulator [Actinophytocola sp.]|jgi:WhiB family redox-sensing transcriptional regulator|uniref:WhiB family transcriptional regulator n=1 Tax=Actinophytocola sp. TaxID=1872138 RepID=UPI002EDA7727